MRSRGGVHSSSLRHRREARSDDRFFFDDLLRTKIIYEVLADSDTFYAASLQHLFVKLLVRAPQKLEFAPRVPPTSW